MIDFTIVVFPIFFAVKAINLLKKKEEEAPKVRPEPSKEEILLAEIRELLQERR